jgi:glycosyltransferase involved in cell wall biosynthesis
MNPTRMIVALRHVLLVSPDRVAPEMAGPGVRYAELARILARAHHVQLAAPHGSVSPADGPIVASYDPERRGSLDRLVAGSDVVVAPPLAPALIRCVERLGRPWIVDLYNPEPFEGLAHARPSGSHDRLRDAVRIDRLAYAARAGSSFICAGERQRDMWLGLLAAHRRLDSREYRRDPELRGLIDVVPFGVPSGAPTRRDNGLRGTVFPADARIMVWNGGVWDWLDPETVLAALALLRSEDPSWQLSFSGVGRPSHRAAMGGSERIRSLTTRLGLDADGAVDVREWTPYADRATPLLDADLGVSAHVPSLEARFAHRARMLDLIWTRTPILCSEGDESAAIVRDEGLGEAVVPQDPEGFAAAAVRIADRGRDFYRAALDAAAAKREWGAVAAPLLERVESTVAGGRRRSGVVGRAVAFRHTAAFALRRPAAALARPRRVPGNSAGATPDTHRP